MYYTFYNYIKNKYYDELQALLPVEREALIFKKICEEIPLSIKDDDLIAGWYGCENGEEYVIEPDRNFEFFDAFSKEEAEQMKAFNDRFVISMLARNGHTCIDYGYILNFGLKKYKEKVVAESENDSLSDDKKAMLAAMSVSLDAVKSYAERFAEIAEDKFKKTNDAKFLKMKNALLKVPYEPADTFYEAITSVWIMHSVIPMSDNSWASISLGRFDQYMYPYYKKALKNEESKEDIKAYIKNLYIYLNSYGDGACALNIGGMDKDGNDETNELSRLLLEVEKEMLTASPIFVVRVNPKTPEDILDECIDLKLFSVGQPTFYGEIPCRNAMIKRGVPEDDAVNFTVNSCMGIFMSGEENASMWGCLFNMHLPLELAINDGKGLFNTLPVDIKKPDLKEVNSLDSLMEAYEKYMSELFRILTRFNRKFSMNCAVNTPNPLLSVLTEGCIQNCEDRAIGAKYNTETIETMALANTANAISAIDTLVFKQKKYSIEDLKEAAKHDFVGYEKILKDIKACEKYGTNSTYADSIAKHLVEISYKLCMEFSDGNVIFIPSLHTLYTNVTFGEGLYTTLDGRIKGTPIAKNAGPTNDVRTADPTSLVYSAAAIKQELFSGGQPIDIYFDKSMFDSSEKREKIKTLIKVYFELGGLQFQVNSLDIEIIEKAYENPEQYPNLVVRIGGYSCNFTDLSKDVQKEFIERFKREKGV